MKIVGFNLKNRKALKESIGLAISTTKEFKCTIFNQEQKKFIETKKTVETNFTLSWPSKIAVDREATIDLPICTSLLINFPAAHGFEIAESPLKKRLHKLGISWPSTHASLVPLTDGQVILKFTILTLAHNNNSHSKYMLPASQRLNVPGNYLPPGLQLILHSTFVITGTIPPINIDRSLEQSRPEMRFLFTANLTAARGTKSIVQPLTRMPIDFSPAPFGLKKRRPKNDYKKI
ncbi:MAG: hypothetical protein NT166_06415 [Candidatus Aminicenantes bacterium]|nr:hypothetical protein [Candidatus Aminicenantes bacterium]